MALGRVWTDDPTYIIQPLQPAQQGIDIGTAEKPFGTIYADNVETENLDIPSADLSVYAAGTPYTLTDTPAAATFGTTSPTITLPRAGTYLLSAQGRVEYVGATFAATKAVTLKLRRTNNTPADITSATAVINTAVVTTETSTLGTAVIPPVVYTTENDSDVIRLFASVEALPGAGSVTLAAGSIVALRIA